MAQLEKTRRSSESPQTPTTSPTFEQYLRAEDAYWSTTLSPTIRKQQQQHDQEENANGSSPTNTKKSVLTKVKERAKKLKHSLSGKKRHGIEASDMSNASPTSLGHVTLDDGDDDENEQYEDPEYLGAPMYESDAAPEICKETARQHPRAVPVVSEKHIFPDSMKHDGIQGNNKSIAPNASQENDKSIAPNKTITETVTEKLAPAYAAVSDATHTIASKIANLTVTTPGTQETVINTAGIVISQREGNAKKMDESSRQFNAGSSQKWDKGISVKEYFMDALEPGEDDKALSEAITDAISPKRSAMGGGSGVVDKVKEAVSSFLWNDESSSNSLKIAKNTSSLAVPTFSRANSDNHLLKSNVHSSEVPMPASAKSQPVSSKYHEVVEEENHGKILQTN